MRRCSGGCGSKWPHILRMDVGKIRDAGRPRHAQDWAVFLPVRRASGILLKASPTARHHREWLRWGWWRSTEVDRRRDNALPGKGVLIAMTVAMHPWRLPVPDAYRLCIHVLRKRNSLTNAGSVTKKRRGVHSATLDAQLLLAALSCEQRDWYVCCLHILDQSCCGSGLAERKALAWCASNNRADLGGHRAHDKNNHKRPPHFHHVSQAPW